MGGEAAAVSSDRGSRAAELALPGGDFAVHGVSFPAGAKPPLEEVRDQIEQLLRLEEINVLLGRWIGEVRQQTHIETYEEKQP
jgi:hypothetical protein